MIERHTVTYTERGPFDWIGRCTCRAVFGPQRTKGMVQDTGDAHVRNIERARAALRTQNPSLEDQQRWYLEQSRDTRNTMRDRQLWKQLADEVAVRINAPAAKNKADVPLF